MFPFLSSRTSSLDAIHAIGCVEFQFLFKSISTGQSTSIHTTRITFVYLRVRAQKQFRRLPRRRYEDISDDRAANPMLIFAEVVSAAPVCKLSCPYNFYNYPETNVAILRFLDAPILQLQ
jgi:hypothetical protein